MIHPQRSRRIPPTRLANALLLAAAASSATISGCTSAIDRTAADPGSARYSDSLVARPVLQVSYGTGAAQTFTVAQGVREYPRVDAPGPAASDTAVVPATTTPTTAPANPNAADISIPASQPDAATTNSVDNTMPSYIPTTQGNDTGLAAVTLHQPENAFHLSLQDAIHRALHNALDIKVQSYNPGINESKLVQQEAVFDPTFFADSNWTNTNEPSGSFVANPGNTANRTLPPVFQLGSSFQDGTFWQNDIGVRKLLSSGANVSVSTGFTYRNLTNASITGFPPGQSIAPLLNATIAQPLLRGFGSDVTEANIYIAQRDQRISLEQFRRQVITTIDTVEEDYHNLILARTSVAIGEQLLLATEDTEKRVSDRITVDADQISISQAQAAVAQRRAELVRERIDLRTASDKLKQDLNDPEINVRDNALIDPSDRPIAEPVVFNVADSIETALRQRTELQEDRLKLEQSDITITVARNDLLPKLDLTASVQSNGLSNEWDSAFGSVVNPGQFIDYSAGIRLEFPLGNRQAEAEVRQRELERNQVLTQTVDDAQKIVIEVKKQLRELMGSYTELREREDSRILAAKELQAITRKEEIVALTPEFLQLKLDSQGPPRRRRTGPHPGHRQLQPRPRPPRSRQGHAPRIRPRLSRSQPHLSPRRRQQQNALHGQNRKLHQIVEPTPPSANLGPHRRENPK